MRRILSLSSVIMLTVMMSSFSYGQAGTVLEINFEDAGATSATFGTSSESFGSQVDNVLLSDLALSPLTITLNPGADSSGDATSGDTGDARAVPLQITLLSGTGTGPGSFVSSNGSSLGINSDGTDDQFVQFDSDFDESLTISFSEDLFLRELDLSGLGGGEEFSFQVAGSSVVLIPNGAADFSDRFDFEGGFAPSGTEGLFLEAGTAIEFRTTIGTVGIENLIVETALPTAAAVPEPSSMLGLMGLAGLLAVKRRR